MAYKLKYVGKFTEDQDDVLVTYVQDHRDIYDPRSVFYKAINVRNRIWQSIATKMDKTDDECRTRWKHIRDSYNRHKRLHVNKRAKSYLNSVSHKTKLRFFEKLKFLDEVIDKNNEKQAEENVKVKNTANMSVPTIIPSSPEQVDEDNDIYDDTHSKNPIEDTSEESQFTFYTHAKKINIYDQKDTSQPNQRNTVRNEKDSVDNDSFGMHVATVLKKLTPRLKIQAKNEIFGILSKYETLNLDLEEQSPSFAGESSIKIEPDD